MEELFARAAHAAAALVEAGAVAIVAFGSLEAFLKLVRIVARPSATHGERKAIWRRFGTWLLLGLEFELAADILGSVHQAGRTSTRSARLPPSASSRTTSWKRIS